MGTSKPNQALDSKVNKISNLPVDSKIIFSNYKNVPKKGTARRQRKLTCVHAVVQKNSKKGNTHARIVILNLRTRMTQKEYP